MQKYTRFAIAIGAGAASALLFAVSATANPLAMVLAYLSPLPIMIATLGWGFDAGALAAAGATVALGLVAGPPGALAFAVSIAVPGWALAAFSIAPVRAWIGRRPATPLDQPSVGAIVAFAAVVAMLGALAALATLIVVHHGYDNAAAFVVTTLTDAIAAEAAAFHEHTVPAKLFAETLVRWGPAAVAASTLLMLCVNLYAAARSTELSQNLVRPWPDLPTSLSLPWPFAVLLILCAGGAFLLPAPASQFALVGVGGLGGAFALQGLAVAHALSRGLKLRPVMLVALYLCCIFRALFFLPALVALGVIDAFTGLRARISPLPVKDSNRKKRS